MKSKFPIAVCMLGFFIAAGGANAAERQTEPYAVNLEELQWGPPAGGNGSPLGLRTALHWHTHDEFVVVVSGSVVLELGDETHELHAGAYIVIPGGMNHSWDVPDSGEVIILVRRAGPADFNYVTQ